MLKKTTLFFILICTLSWSQEKVSLIDSKLTYSSKNGYVITQPFSAVYDHFGWLWIVGKTDSDCLFSYENNKHLTIQRYDGTNFYTVKLPEFKEKYSNAQLIKHKNGKLLLLCFSEKAAVLYEINPATLSFTKLTDFKEWNQHFTAIKIYPYKDGFRMFMQQNQTIQHYSFNNHFSLLASLSLKKSEIINTENSVINTLNNTVLLSTNKAAYAFSTDGKRSKQIPLSKPSLSLNNSYTIIAHFNFNNQTNVIFKEIPGVFHYNHIKNSFTKNNSFTIPIDKSSIINAFQEQNNLCLLTKKNNTYKLHYIDISKTPYTTHHIIRAYSRPLITYRNPSKELVFVSNQQLTHFFIANSKNFTTYLSNYTIKTVKELDSIRFLVETSENGWFLINIQNTTQIPVNSITDSSLKQKCFFLIKNLPIKPVLNTEPFEQFLPKNETKSNILTIKKTALHGTLIGTKNGKLYQFNPVKKTFTLLYKDFRNAAIVAILTDNTHTIWLSTYAGIIAYNTNTQKIRYFSKKDGVHNLKGSLNCALQTADDYFLIGSQKGISYFNPLTVTEKQVSSSPTFTAIGFFNEKKGIWEEQTAPNYLNNVKEITLPASYQRYQVKFGILDIINSSDFFYKFKILGDNSINQTWTSLGNKNEISFANVQDGKYVLQIAAFTKANEKTGKTLSLTVNSKTVFYKTWYFITFSVLLFLFILGYFLYQFAERQKLNAKHQIAKNETKMKENMMREIHHRVKNNLQVISGLLNLQSLTSNNKELSEKLQDSQGRIEAIAGIHNILYNNDSKTATVKKIFNQIISYSKKLYPINISFHSDIDAVDLPIEKANSLTLILNELISNSFKHAFSNTKKPSISIKFKKEGTYYNLTYLDNGIYKNKGNENTLGMQIIHLMAEELEGDLTTHTSENFGITLRFRAS